MMKRGDVGRNFFALIIVGHQSFVARAGQMNDLQRQSPCSAGNDLIIAWLIPLAPWLPPMTSSVSRSSRSPSFCRAGLAIDALKLCPNRRAGHFRSHFRKKWRAFLESEQNRPHHPRGQCDSLCREWHSIRE